jgi:hypothetical protein
LLLQRDQVASRLSRLTDAYLDGMIDQQEMTIRKATLLTERRILNEQLENLEAGTKNAGGQLSEFLELAGSAYSAYERASPEETRQLLAAVTSNRVLNFKTLLFTLESPFEIVATRRTSQHGSPSRSTPRLSTAAERLVRKCEKQLKGTPGALTEKIRAVLRRSGLLPEPLNTRFRSAA